MGLAVQFAGVRIWKAKVRRAASLRGRPEWQDTLPGTKQGRDTYRIAAKYERTFSDIFRGALKDFMPGDMPSEFKAAVDVQSSVGAYNALALVLDVALDKFGDRIGEAIGRVVQEAGDAETANLNKRFKTNLKFEAIQKAKNKLPIVPVNPYSIVFMRERSAQLIKNIKASQAETIQQILTRNFEKGFRAENIYNEIKAHIGLLPRDEAAVFNRRERLSKEGYSARELDALSEKYRDDLLDSRAERIAQTETVSAQARGREDAWRVASASGELPAAHREWFAAPPSGAKDRPCEYCLEMHGATAPIDGTYDSPFGPIEGPPLHPLCRCSEILVEDK